MPSNNTPVIADDVLAAFSDRAIDGFIFNFGLPAGTDRSRLRAGICAAVARYIAASQEPTSNTVRNEIVALHRAISKRHYTATSCAWGARSAPVRRLFEDRASWIRSSERNRKRDTGRRWWTVPTPEALLSGEHRAQACRTIHSLSVIGAYRKQRKTQGGKPSFEVVTILNAPAPSRAEPRRAAERIFLVWLRVAYAEATGLMPPKYVHHDRPGPFAKMVAECLRLAGAPSHEPDDDRRGLSVQLINDIEKVRKRSELVAMWRRLIRPIRHHQVVVDVSQRIEDGKAAIRRVPAGAGEDQTFSGPALIEFEGPGTLCFLLRANHWRTLKLPPDQRAEIMQLASRLQIRKPAPPEGAAAP